MASSFKVLIFLKSPSLYCHAEILLFVDDINKISYSFIKTVHNIVNFLFKSFLLVSKNALLIN